MSMIILNERTQPSIPTAGKGALYYDSSDEKLKFIQDEGIVNTLSNAALTARNVLTNGAFAIQQKIAAASTVIAGMTTTTRAGVVADRWAVNASSTSGVNWQQVDTIGAPETGLLSRYYGSIINTAAKKVMISQFVISNDMAHLRGQKVRLSVKLNQKVGNAQTVRLGLIYLNQTGTVDVCPTFMSSAFPSTTIDPSFGTNLVAIAPDPVGNENGTVNGTYLDITTKQTAWTRSSALFTVPTNAKNLIVVLFTSAVGGTTDNLSIAEFQLTEGQGLVDYVATPYSEEILRCERFYCKSFPIGIVPASGVALATGGAGAVGVAGKAATAAQYIPIVFPIRMWKAPAMTYYSPVGTLATMYDYTVAAVGGTFTTVANTITDVGCYGTATGNATTAVGNPIGIHYVADAEIIN